MPRAGSRRSPRCTRRASPVVFGAAPRPDFKDSTTDVLAARHRRPRPAGPRLLLQGDLKDKLAAYRAHVGKMLALGGESRSREGGRRCRRGRDGAREADEDARSRSATRRRRTTRSTSKGLGKLPSARLEGVLQGARHSRRARDRRRRRRSSSARSMVCARKLKPAQWASYFTYQLLADASFALPKAFDDEDVRADEGADRPASSSRAQQALRRRDRRRARRAARRSSTSRSTSRRRAKQSAVALVDALVAAMSDDLGTLDWMSDADHEDRAATSSRRSCGMVGYPDKWRHVRLRGQAR